MVWIKGFKKGSLSNYSDHSYCNKSSRNLPLDSSLWGSRQPILVIAGRPTPQVSTLKDYPEDTTHSKPCCHQHLEAHESHTAEIKWTSYTGIVIIPIYCYSVRFLVLLFLLILIFDVGLWAVSPKDWGVTENVTIVLFCLIIVGLSTRNYLKWISYGQWLLHRLWWPELGMDLLNLQ